jgi:hypothetical protein
MSSAALRARKMDLYDSSDVALSSERTCHPLSSGTYTISKPERSSEGCSPCATSSALRPAGVLDARMHREQREVTSPWGQVRQEVHSSVRNPWMQGAVMTSFVGTQGYHFRDSTPIVYHFENVFDRRSGPRRGLNPVSIPIQPSP